MSELLESRWQDTKTALLEGLEGNKKSVMSATLENTRSTWLRPHQVVQLVQATLLR